MTKTMNKPTNNRCQYDGCKEEARYALYRTLPDGRKVWIHVCKECERIVGFVNLKRAGGRFTGVSK